MQNIWVIARKEFTSYFSSVVAYSIAFLVLTILGVIFAFTFLSLATNPYISQAPDSRIVTGPLAFLILLATPALTMRLIADEFRMGTMELLMTTPIHDYQLVIGKWFGAFLFELVLISISLIFPLILNQLVHPGIDQKQLIVGYLGVILVASALLGLGTGISAMFQNPFAAFFTTLTLFIILWWLIGVPSSLLSTGGDFFSYLDIGTQVYENFSLGVIKLTNLTYLISLTVIGLATGVVALDFKRWK
jgi:ABC-2 type transport system permease protein